MHDNWSENLKQSIRAYTRNARGQRTGVLFAYKDKKDKVRIGWSKCNTRLDLFDKDKAIDIALGRANAGSTVDLPRDIKKLMPYFLERAKRYFKVEAI